MPVYATLIPAAVSTASSAVHVARQGLNALGQAFQNLLQPATATPAKPAATGTQGAPGLTPLAAALRLQAQQADRKSVTQQLDHQIRRSLNQEQVQLQDGITLALRNGKLVVDGGLEEPLAQAEMVLSQNAEIPRLLARLGPTASFAVRAR